MNLCQMSFDKTTVGALEDISRSGRLPHALIIESRSAEKALELSVLLSAYAVCSEENKPCGSCPQCVNALEKTHPDILFMKPDKREGRKSDTYSIDQIRDTIRDAYIKPNNGTAKVYIFEKCDTRLSADVTQNALLKIIEEPPRNVYFFFLCASSRSLLVTIRSRCAQIRMESSSLPEGEILNKAERIAEGMAAATEYGLLLALRALEDKSGQVEIIDALSMIFRDALAILNSGGELLNSPAAKKLAARCTKGKIIQLLELNSNAKEKIRQNVRTKLLCTWLCGEYRRITWQR